MSSEPASRKVPAKGGDRHEATLEALSGAIESGAGLPAVARAAAKALGASVALIDRSSAVLAVAASSSAEEGKLLSDAEDVESVELRVADAVVGELRYRARGEPPSPALTRMVSTLLALEVERSRAPEWASDEAAGGFVRAVLAREVTDRGDIVARAAELGAEIEAGAGVVIARAAPRDRAVGRLAGAGADGRAAGPSLDRGGLARGARRGRAGGGGGDRARRRGRRSWPVPRRAWSASWPPRCRASRSPWRAAAGPQDPVDLYRAGKEALLAANVAEAEGRALLAFEDTGAYRLLLPAMSEDPGELERFYEETLAPLAAYDEQYETELVTTVEAYLENDGNVAQTAAQLFTHRHTVRYRLERVRELTGHDISSSEGREKLSLGLKAMRVLGIAAPRGPATEPGTEAGRVSRPAED